jgi:predicted nucleotidyltransferase
MDVERCKKLFHFSRTSIAASLRQMNRGVMSDLSKLARALTNVNERTLAREETADETIKLLREKSEIFEEEAVALKDENEKLRRSSAMKQSGNDHAVALSLSYQRHVPRLRAAATRCASHTQGVRDAIKAVLEEYGEALSADTTKLRKAVVSVQRNAKRESDDASKLRCIDP